MKAIRKCVCIYLPLSCVCWWVRKRERSMYLYPHSLSYHEISFMKEVLSPIPAFASNILDLEWNKSIQTKLWKPTNTDCKTICNCESQDHLDCKSNWNLWKPNSSQNCIYMLFPDKNKTICLKRTKPASKLKISNSFHHRTKSKDYYKTFTERERDLPWVTNKIIGNNILVFISKNAFQWALWGIPLFKNSRTEISIYQVKSWQPSAKNHQ